MPDVEHTQSGHAQRKTAFRHPPLTTLLVLLTVATTLSGQSALSGASGGDWFSDASRRHGGVELREERRRDPQPTRPRANELARSLIAPRSEQIAEGDAQLVLSHRAPGGRLPPCGIEWWQRTLNLPPPVA
jgi:hypothetical protein